jgi:hypothetical protein
MILDSKGKPVHTTPDTGSLEADMSLGAPGVAERKVNDRIGLTKKQTPLKHMVIPDVPEMMRQDVSAVFTPFFVSLPVACSRLEVLTCYYFVRAVDPMQAAKFAAYSWQRWEKLPAGFLEDDDYPCILEHDGETEVDVEGLDEPDAKKVIDRIMLCDFQRHEGHKANPLIAVGYMRTGLPRWWPDTFKYKVLGR